MLDRLYTLLLQFKEYVILILLLVVSLVLLSQNDNRQVRFVRSISSVVLGAIQDQVAFIPRYMRLREENTLLRKMNIELSDEANRLREAKLESARLRNLLIMKEQPEYGYRPAEIVGKNLLLMRNTLTLNVGTKDGIIPSMPVVSDAGLVGVVVGATPYFSVVNILLNVEFRASAKIQRSRVDGILAWDGSNLLLTNVPKTMDVKAGDLVITSEYSSTFPPGVRVGLVRGVTIETGSLFKKIIVEPSVDFTRLEEVFVMTVVPNRERITLEQSVNPSPLR